MSARWWDGYLAVLAEAGIAYLALDKRAFGAKERVQVVQVPLEIALFDKPRENVLVGARHGAGIEGLRLTVAFEQRKRQDNVGNAQRGNERFGERVDVDGSRVVIVREDGHGGVAVRVHF